LFGGTELKDLEAGFVEVEKRVKTLLKDNADQRKRIARLEQELVRLKSASEDLESFRGKRLHIREKIEKVLQSLEAAGGKDA
jgi:cell division septum initiation protein DivIVA